MNWREFLRFIGYSLMIVLPLAFILIVLIMINNPYYRLFGQDIVSVADHVLGAWTFLPPAISWALSGFLLVGSVHFVVWESHRFTVSWIRFGILALPVGLVVAGLFFGPFLDMYGIGAAYLPQGGNTPAPGSINVVHGIELVWVPPGRYFMGSPVGEIGRNVDESRHFVTIRYGFWIGRYEITQAQWNSVMEITDILPPDEANKPVTYVSWVECNDFIGKLNFEVKSVRFRLPTEAEWEFACRALTTTPYSFGDDPAKLQDYAWFAGNSEEKIHPVGLKQPNPLGLYDMAGNVCEWCVDYYGEYPSGRGVDPTGAQNGSCHVARGGAWNSPPTECRSASRVPLVDDYRVDRKTVGLRVVIGPNLPGVIAPLFYKPNPNKALIDAAKNRRQQRQ
jgi:formylglycine-generating enzyme required for sulfatase activity